MPPLARATASSTRTVPTRQGTHCPQLSSRKNRATRRTTSCMSRVELKSHDDPRAEGHSGGTGGLEGERQIEVLRPDEGAGCPPEQNCSQIARRSPGQVDEIAQRGAELDLVNTGPAHITREAEETRPARIGRTDGREGGAPFREDAIDVDEGLDIVDDCGPVEEARLHRERWLLARFASKALDRVEQSRLFAAYVCALSAADLDIEREVRSENVGTEQTCRPGRIRSQPRGGRWRRGYSPRTYRYPRVAPTACAAMVIASITRKGVAFHDDAVLEGAGFGLIGIAHHDAGSRFSATASHLTPVGKAAPPRPLRPDFLISSITATGPISRAFDNAR